MVKEGKQPSKIKRKFQEAIRMKFHVIDREDWNREQYFEHYLKLKCTFSMTVNVDITMLLEELYQKE